MSAQEQVSKLQGLLERIRKNASRPRASAPTATASATFAPAMAAPPAPAPYVAPPPANFDAVDDLLGVSPEPSPMPLDVDVPLDSVPPVAEISSSQAPDADPIPLVSVASGRAAPPPIDDAFGLDSEVSEVRVTTATREPAAQVTVAAIEAEAEALDPEELSEDDLVEVTDGTPPPAATDVDLDFEDEEEQPPASSQRKVASSMDEALAAAAEQLEAEREVPLQTPPPESGRQEALAPIGRAALAAPDVDALLGGELDIPTRSDAGMATRGPTPEQLGQTIELEEARGPSLELAEHRVSTPAPPAMEELEAAVPGPTMVGGYDASLAPPPEARDELEAHRRRLDEDAAPPPESLATLPSVQPGAPVAEIVPIFRAPEGPEVIGRQVAAGRPESFGSVRETFRPSSFVELLDASLALHGQ